ncbi:MAG TPA: class I SAM-dependent methyltransferase [Streptosporangiaceae bacterium]|nr:class I SAM-dependent methyltransferase [Streptosporangiaceae bacterium]
MTDTMDATAFTRGPAAALFSSYVAAAAVSAASELGILDVLARQDCYDIPAATASAGLDETVVRRLLAALVWAGAVRVERDEATPGPQFDALYAARGYFYWLVRGCGGLFSDAGAAVSAQRVGEFYTRDMRAVAIGSRLIGDALVEPLFDEILDGLHINMIADLGCGSGQRLLRVADRHPKVRGLGIDIAPQAVELANLSIDQAGQAHRLTVVQGDVLDLGAFDPCTEVEVVTCVFMGHDFWPRERCVAALSSLRRAFPNASQLLLCDVVRSDCAPGPDTGIFTLGFELIHALMGVYLPAREEWLGAFADAGWELVRAIDVAAPPGCVLFDLRPARATAR